MARSGLIPSLEASKAISARRADAVVVSTVRTLEEWSLVSSRRDLDMDLSDCENKAPAVALGIALAQPKRKVLVLDSDGALRTNLSGLVTVANAAPENLVHFLYEEAIDTTQDGDSGPGFNRVSYRALAEGAGYAATYRFEALEDLLIGLEEAMGGPGPTFVSLSVAPSWGPSTPATRPMAESARVVKRALERPTEP